MPTPKTPPADDCGSIDALMDDGALFALFGIHRITLARWRRDRGFPAPCFYVAKAAYTRRSRVLAWMDQQPKVSSQAGRRIGERGPLAPARRAKRPRREAVAAE